MAYLERVVDQQLSMLWDEAGAIAIDGPKGVGKTATARRRAVTVFELDDVGQLAILRAQPSAFLTSKKPILIDEWQRVPPVWDVVRRAIDRDSSPKQFLLTGSAMPDATTHSGAGRILTLRMRPLSFAERHPEQVAVSLSDLVAGRTKDLSGSCEFNVVDYVDEICRSGLPGLRKYSDEVLSQYLDAYIERIVDHDFPEMGVPVRKPALLRRWMAAYAAATSTTTSYEKIRDAATSDVGDKPAKSTTQPYRDVLERMWILDPVAAWTPQRNHISQLSTPPKHHLADPALAAHLLGSTPERLLRPTASDSMNLASGSLLGSLFESLVTLSVRVYAQPSRSSVMHFRTQGGDHEVDLIVQRPDGRVLAVEVKLNSAVTDTDVKQLKWLRDRIGDEMVDAVVINTGPMAYRRPDGIGVVPLALLGV